MEICVNYNATRKWVELPADIEDIANEFGVNLDEDDGFFEEDLLIEDIETDLDFKQHRLKEFTLQELNDMAECEDNYHDEAVAISEAYSLTAVNWTTCRNACIARVESTEELGEYLVDNDYLGPIPANLADYLDYGKIGDDWKWDGTWTSTGFLFNL